MHWLSRILTVSTSLLPLTTGCPADDEPADTDGSDTGGGSDGTSSGPVADDGDGAGPSGEVSDDAPDDGDDVDDEGPLDDTTDDGSDDVLDTGDSGGDLPGTCVGLVATGHIASVWQLEGGGEIDETCDDALTPCGGDIVGQWNIAASCGYDNIANPLEMMCPGATFMVELVEQSGSVVFGEDGSFMQTLQTETLATIALDTMECFMISCEVFEGALMMQSPSATCEDVDGICNCTIAGMGGMPVEGTYEVVDDEVVVTIDGAVGSTPFCAEGDRLTLWQPVYDPTATMVACATAEDCEAAIGGDFDEVQCVE